MADWLPGGTAQAQFLAVGLDVAAKAALLWSAAFLAAFLLGHRRALARSAVWQACLLSWILLPLAAVFLPRMRLGCLPEPPSEARAGLARDPASLHAEPGEARSFLAGAALLYEEVIAGPRSAGRVVVPARDGGRGLEAGGGGGSRRAARPEPGRFDWRLAALAIYAAGAAFLAARLAVSLHEVRRLRRSGFILRGAFWAGALDEWKRKLGVHGPIELACSSAISVPVAFGWRRPRILLPPGFVLGRLRKHRGSVLAHELAHVRRGDYLWQLLTHAVRIAYWPHPLAWVLDRSIGRAREEACDDVSVFFLRSSRRYRTALLRLARLALHRSALGLGLAVARSSDLGQRIVRIERGYQSSRCAVPWPLKGVLATILLFAAGVVGALELGRRAVAPEVDLSERAVGIRVVERSTGAPMDGAWVAGFLHDAGSTLAVSPSTDREGRTTFSIPTGAGWEGFTVRVKKEGFVPISLEWRDQPPGTEPTELRFDLDPAAAIGGRVVNEAGQPIERAAVHVLGPGKLRGERVDLLDDAFVTDREGRWRCDLAPTGELAGFMFRAIHPEYLGTAPEELPGNPLRDQSHVLVLKRGLTVEGRILDLAGRPVAGAAILEGQVALKFQPGRRLGLGNIVQSGLDGRFRFGCAAPGDFRLTVEARGFAPAMVEVAASPTASPVEIRLQPGRTARGRVVDAAGRPIAGVHVEVDSWRRTANLDWSTVTDAEGRFVWADAPHDMAFLGLAKRGYVSLHGREIVPSEEERVFVLDPVVRVRGTVVDSGTGKPVEKFTVTRGTVGTSRYHWEKASVPCAEGRYDVVFPEPRPFQVLRVEAAGYAAVVSRELRGSEGLQVLDFALAPGLATQGVVTDGAGHPVEGARLAVLSSSRLVTLIDGKLGDEPGHGASTGPRGDFTLSPQEPGHGLLALHERGWALVEVVDPSRPLAIRLQDWGRIEGDLRPGGRGLAGERILLESAPDRERLRCQAAATTGEGGRFACERLLPGEWRITHEVDIAPGAKRAMFQSTRDQTLEVASGAPTRVVIGGGGRAVLGRLVRAAASTGDADWTAGWAHLYRRPAGEGALPVQYAAALAADGSFRLDDVASGPYELAVQVHDAARRKLGVLGQELASLRRAVEVPAAVEAGVALDLGSLEVTVHRELKIGEPAPGFVVQTLSGETVRLEDFRGRVVLIDFWATWCGICVARMDDLQQLQAAFADRKDFVLLGLSLDRDAEAPRRFAAERGLGWTQAWIGEWNESAVRAEYGISSIPRMVLIDRDGRIAAKDLMSARPGGITSLVAEALARRAGS